jgi:hypothetical protein|tara:strand:- start:2980 stop:3249 length:270 start_codon:yes stop_codon:yes gene_type:complete
MAIQIPIAVAATLTSAVVARLGMATVTFVGVSAILAVARDRIISQLQGISGDAASLIGLTGVDTGMMLILSAYSVRLAMWAGKKITFSR